MSMVEETTANVVVCLFTEVIKASGWHFKRDPPHTYSHIEQTETRRKKSNLIGFGIKHRKKEFIFNWIISSKIEFR